jgi:hypothetical protein
MMDLSEEPISEEEALDEFTREQEWLNEHDLLTRAQREELDKLGWLEFAEELMNNFRRIEAEDQILEREEIAKAWASTIDGWQQTTYEKYVELKNQYSSKIIQAVFDRKLNAEVTRWNKKGVKEVIQGTLQALNEVKKDYRHAGETGEHIHLEIYIDREEFRTWLEASKPKQILSKNCLLNKWFEPTKTKGRNEIRMKIFKDWFQRFCTTHEHKRDVIEKEINLLTNAQIIGELLVFTETDYKYLWRNGATRWIKDNGAKVYGFKKDQGVKLKKL